ncbi:MAG: hypothetical protein KGO50_08020, partial [Myxococcales bacterium]|nr:hypothetical protein [Myxococcales bacterium]
VKRIVYDYTNLTSDVVGESGICASDMESLRLRASIAVDDFVELASAEDVTFPRLPELSVDDILARASQDQAKFTDFVVIGIGGSSLGARAVHTALTRKASGRMLDGSPRKGPRLHFIENVDPIETIDLLDSLPLATTLFNVITKSGNTIETLSTFAIVRERLIEQFGQDGYRDRVVVTTDPERGPLRMLAKREGLFSFDVPPEVGGRFSVLSAVGLYPLAVAGIDIVSLLRGAARARDRAFDRDLDDNAALLFAVHQVALYEKDIRQVVMMPYAQNLTDLSAWFVQLWAESLGKKRRDENGAQSHVGPTPIAALGVTDQHSQLQLYMEGPNERSILFIEVESCSIGLDVPSLRGLMDGMGHIGGRPLEEVRRAELQGVREGLAEESRPTATLVLPRVSAESIGELIMFFEAATSFAGSLLRIDPFNQPGVELGKRYAHGLLGREKESHYANRFTRAMESRVRRVVSL